MALTKRCDVLVVGGGTSGAAAAWQAARMGVKVVLAEPTVWCGGMITAAGVSAFDGNEGPLGGGLFGRLRGDIERHYGGADAVRTGWVSNTCFSPDVANRLLADYLAETSLDFLIGATPREVLRAGDRVTGVAFDTPRGQWVIYAEVVIEATECGDLLALGDVPFRLGRDSRAQTGEAHAPEQPDMELQDMTYVATLQRYPGGAPPVAMPDGVDVKAFDCATREWCSTPDEALLNHTLHEWESFLTYGLLPGGRFMLNWPHHCNDADPTGMFGTEADRAACIAAAKAKTLAFVHHIQTTLGHRSWGLAEMLYPTRDQLPLIPYVRESRRVVPVRWMVESDVVPVAGAARAPHQPDSIAVGDYFLDHHHSKAHLPAAERLVEDYPANAPFQVPYSALVPAEVDGLLCAEKNIGVTHIVNGCTRLQPVVMLIGQAVGAAAALSVLRRCQPRDVNTPELQGVLLGEGCMLVPDPETPASRQGFREHQERLLQEGD